MHKRDHPLDSHEDTMMRLERHSRRMDEMDKRSRLPTIPIYDSENWPADAVDGQLARDINDPDSIWQYQDEDSGGDNAWHQIGGGGKERLFSPIQVAHLFEIDINGVWYNHWNLNATQDSQCLHGGRIMSDGTQNAYLAFRFGLGPRGSFWAFNIMHTAGPDHGIMFGYLASLTENDPFVDYTSPAGGTLEELSEANYILSFKIDCYDTVFTRNKKKTVGVAAPSTNFFGTTLFRVRGANGAPFTARGLDDPGNPGPYAGIDGGPGIYALKLVMEGTSNGGYVGGLQALSASRADFAYA